jgi:hypothetical protein
MKKRERERERERKTPRCSIVNAQNIGKKEEKKKSSQEEMILCSISPS